MDFFNTCHDYCCRYYFSASDKPIVNGSNLSGIALDNFCDVVVATVEIKTPRFPTVFSEKFKCIVVIIIILD